MISINQFTGNHKEVFLFIEVSLLAIETSLVDVIVLPVMIDRPPNILYTQFVFGGEIHEILEGLFNTINKIKCT
jgi:hypothetical protein